MIKKGNYLLDSVRICTFCTSKGVIWRNEVQNVEIKTVAKSLPLFWGSLRKSP